MQDSRKQPQGKWSHYTSMKEKLEPRQEDAREAIIENIRHPRCWQRSAFPAPTREALPTFSCTALCRWAWWQWHKTDSSRIREDEDIRPGQGIKLHHRRPNQCNICMLQCCSDLQKGEERRDNRRNLNSSAPAANFQLIVPTYVCSRLECVSALVAC